MLISRSKAYWICQLTGWGLYGVAIAMFYVYSEGTRLTPERIAALLIMSATGLTLTHLFRSVVKKYNWWQLSQLRIIFQVLAANLLMAIAYSFINIASELALGLIALQELTTGELIISVGILIVNAWMLLLLWSVIYFAIAFFIRYRKEEIERLKWESSVKDFELKKLKSQLNPHFVFNALNSIRSLIDEDPAKAKQAITQLSNLLRNSLLADRSRTIPLEEELKTVNDYIQLEKIRYEDRLQASFEVSAEVQSVQVPPMMIQTLVENAVKHGVSTSTTGGYIKVAAHAQGDELKITITNTGRLHEKAPSSVNGTGFGIINTKQRLQLLYGGQEAFHIEQIDENTVMATILIPMK